MPQLPDEYTVRLDAFQGPLELLFQLIRRAELDITEIALATITDQYLHHLEALRDVDVDAAGEFLVVAATLLEIKSRHLNPADEQDATAAARHAETDTADPAAQLLESLLQYKAYRDAAAHLEHRKAQWDQRFPAKRAHADKHALRDAVGGEDALDLEDLSLFDIVNAFEQISKTIQFDRLGSHQIEADDTPIELHAADVADQLQRRNATTDTNNPLPLRELFRGRRKAEIIGLFLAVLELVKQRRLDISRGEHFDTDPADIRLALRPNTPDDNTDDNPNEKTNENTDNANHAKPDARTEDRPNNQPDPHRTHPAEPS